MSLRKLYTYLRKMWQNVCLSNNTPEYYKRWNLIISQQKISYKDIYHFYIKKLYQKYDSWIKYYKW